MIMFMLIGYEVQASESDTKVSTVTVEFTGSLPIIDTVIEDGREITYINEDVKVYAKSKDNKTVTVSEEVRGFSKVGEKEFKIVSNTYNVMVKNYYTELINGGGGYEIVDDEGLDYKIVVGP